MDRREFMIAGAGSTLGAAALVKGISMPTGQAPSDIRAMFPRLQRDVWLNTAGGTPLSSFTQAALRNWETHWRDGSGPEPWSSIPEMMDDVRQRLAALIGAAPGEIAFTQCTKAGEQIVLNRLKGLREGGNIVTNDLHFSGSLHQYEGLRRQGIDVRIVKSRGYDLGLEDMAAAIDDETALVSVTYVSNVNGRFEPMRELTDLAHAHGAHVYADIIQAAGIVPLDMEALGLDFAAGNGYKWLFGPWGTGFLYVRRNLQGGALAERGHPGHIRQNYAPWVETPDPAGGEFIYQERDDATRYQPGHVNYPGYCCLAAGLAFIDEIGVETLCDHSVRLCRRLVERLDGSSYACFSPHIDRSPIVTFGVGNREALAERLAAARVFVSLGRNRMRVSPGIYSNDDDIDQLADVLLRS